MPPFLVGVAATLLLLRRSQVDGAPAALGNPLALGAALRMALLFQVVLYVLAWTRGAFGAQGVLWSAALLGLTDMDALTFSMGKLGGDPQQVAVAARALGVGLLSNTLLKAAIALLLGAGAVRRFAVAALLVVAASSGLVLLVL